MKIPLSKCVADAERCTIGARVPHGHHYVISTDPSHDAMLFYLEGALVCGHCGEEVYPHVTVVRNHVFTCEGTVLSWWSDDLEIEVHRCEQEPLADHVHVAVADLLLAGV